jgi:hypothetical protein
MRFGVRTRLFSFVIRPRLLDSSLEVRLGRFGMLLLNRRLFFTRTWVFAFSGKNVFRGARVR